MKRIVFAGSLAGWVLVAALIGVALSSCSGAAAFRASEKGLETLGQDFVACGELYNSALDSGKISKEQYVPWSDFAKKFKPAYAAAIELWKAALDANDAVMQQGAVATLVNLAGDLTKLYEDVRKLISEFKDGGM